MSKMMKTKAEYLIDQMLGETVVGENTEDELDKLKHYKDEIAQLKITGVTKILDAIEDVLVEY
jgi:hypothetical protein